MADGRRHAREQVEIDLGEDDEVVPGEPDAVDTCNLRVMVEPGAAEAAALMQDEGRQAGGVEYVDMAVDDADSPPRMRMIRGEEIYGRQPFASRGGRKLQPAAQVRFPRPQELAKDDLGAVDHVHTSLRTVVGRFPIGGSPAAHLI